MRLPENVDTGDAVEVLRRSMSDEEQRTCRFHGTSERVLEEDTVDGLTFVRLSCGCWQREPGSGEVVLSRDGGYEDVWGRFG